MEMGLYNKIFFFNYDFSLKKLELCGIFSGTIKDNTLEFFWFFIVGVIMVNY